MIHRHSRTWYTRSVLAAILILALLVPALSVVAAPPAAVPLAPSALLVAPSVGLAAGEGRVDVYPGPERPGLSRRACGFKDGIGIRRGEIVDNRVVVTSTGNQEYYRSARIGALDNYAVQSLACVRSGTTGKLVVVVGGFYAGSSGQQSLTLSTDYPIQEEISCERNPACAP